MLLFILGLLAGAAFVQLVYEWEEAKSLYQEIKDHFKK